MRRGGRKEKLETRDGDRVRDSKKEGAKERMAERAHEGGGGGDRKAVRTMDKEGTRLEKREAYALTISGIFWQEYQSCDCVKEGEQRGEGIGKR